MKKEYLPAVLSIVLILSGLYLLFGKHGTPWLLYAGLLVLFGFLDHEAFRQTD